MIQPGFKTVCMFCALLVSSSAQPTPGPSAEAGSQIGAPAPGPASSRVQTRDLTQSPFSRVALCAPFTVLVQPSEGYEVTIDADEAVKEAITTLIDGDTLLLESNAFTTTNPIKVTVGLPATALSAVTARGTFPAIVAPGFTTPKLTINAQGTSQLNVLGIDTGMLTLVNSGYVLAWVPIDLTEMETSLHLCCYFRICVTSVSCRKDLSLVGMCFHIGASFHLLTVRP